MAIHNDMFMGYELSGLLTGSGKTQSEQSIVEPGFQKHKQILTGDTFPCTRFFVKITELSLEQSVGVFCFLLLFQLNGVFRLTGKSGSAMFTRTIGFSLKRFAWSENGLFESSGLLLLGSPVSCHRIYPYVKLNSSSFGWAATVVWNGRVILDRIDLKSAGCQCSYSCFPATSRAFYKDIHLAQTYLIGS